MDMTDPQWDRLGRLVRQRRAQLGLSQKALGERDGPSDTLVGTIEAGKWRPTRGVNDTLRKIDTALAWSSGSSSRILAGGEPTPLPSESAAEVHAQQTQQESTDDYLINIDAGARAIKLIGDRLLTLMREHAADGVGVVAAILADMATEYADALFAAVEENRMRELRFAEPTTAAMLAARHFRSIHDATKPTPAQQAQPDELGKAPGASAPGARRIWEAKSPDKEQP